MEMDLDKSAMLLLLSLNRLKTAERLTVTVNKARNLLLVDKKGKLGNLNFSGVFCIFKFFPKAFFYLTPLCFKNIIHQHM